uniref:BMERB domain-containing protein n=1 Tax=Culex tarsalis TaxID=7177 RepID=A0A1Q3FJ95_CULTA
MEKISAENLTLHRSCLKCHHCHTNLRLGGYAFDRDDPEGKFYCTQHFKLPSKTVKPVPKRSLPRTPQQVAAPTAAVATSQQAQPSTPDSKSSGINFDLLDRGETPERIEFENADEAISDGEAAMEVIDENEWTDRNFGTESDESDEEISSSDESDSDSDSDYEEAAGSPLGAQTLQLASEWISDKRFTNMVDSDDDFYGYSSEDDEADSQTEGEELARAREMRMQEVKLMPPPTLPTDTETEGGSDSDSNSEEVNSATEISTDSEFDHEPSHHRLPPRIFIDDSHLRRPAKVQVKQMTIDNGVRQRRQFSAATNVRNLADNKQRSPGDDDPYYKRDIHLEFKPLIEVDPTIKLSQNRAPLSIPRPGDYTLSKTASTEGIASKKSLELKKKYLLGESTAGIGVLKSGSASALDSKFKSFHSNITECQKLLNPAPEISPTMQTFLQKTAAPPPATATSLLSLRKEAMLTGRNEEKENVYDGKIAPKRYAETVNATLVENKLNELKKEEAKDKKDDRPNNNNERLIETISLITPEKETRKVEDEQTEQKPIVEEDGDRIVEIKNISNLKHMFIDLTSDSPNCDRSLVETTLNFSMTPPSAAKGSTTVQGNGELKNNIPDIISSIKIDSNENKVEEEDEQERTRSPAHETSIQVPEVPWNKEREDEEDIDSDSISEASSSSSSSSTSSVDDIPHFILDSTTSPETHNDERFVPRVEVRDTAGELMQIDSLMIIDGKYIGDPEDLKLLEELPPDTKIAAKISQQEMNLDSICVLQSRDEKVLEEDTLATPTEQQLPPPIPLPVLELEPKEEPVEQTTASKPSSPTHPKPDLKFDTRNENKLDTLKNLPLVLDLQPSSQPPKPRNLSFAANRKSPETDAEKTPLAPSQLLPQLAKAEGSDSETELTAQNLTETELSDWAADDAVSENFVDIEFALSSNKGTIRRNKPKHGRLQQKKVIAAASPKVPTAPVEVRQQASEDGIMKNLAIEDIEFMDTGSEEESCIESYSTTNRTMLKNRGYVEFVDPKSAKPAVFAIGNSYGQQQLPPPLSKPKLVEAINKQVAGVDYIEQGAYLLNSAAADDSKTPMNEEPPTKITFSALAAQNKALQQQPQQMDSLNDIEEDSLLIVTSSQGTATTTEESEAPTIVAPVERTTGGSGSSGRGSVSSFSSKQLEGDKSVGGSPVRKVSTESSSGGKRSSLERNLRKDSLKSNIDDIGYDEYVKRLQQKIALISSARDSLEVKKSKRKSSKGDAGLDDASVTEPVKKPAAASIYTEQSSLEVPKSVEKKIEEITKERVKQKDIIHDLVMDKLQTKKQLNAEKRLNRSRNRNNVLPGVSPGTPNHPTIAHPPEGFPSYQPVVTDRRPFAQPTPVPIFPNKENIASFATPAAYLQPATPRTTAKKPAEETLTLTEQLREEARARARLKSNQDLGLSPEDRVQLLRKKFHINLRELNDQQPNKCDDAKFKERTTKLMTSKSVNDVSILKNLSNDPDFVSPVDDGSPAAALIGAKLQDYVSDPNLVQSPTTGSSGAASDEIRLRTRSKCKDRERRKSIIEKVSEFFNSRKKTESGSATGTGGSSGSKDSSPTKKEGGGSGNELAVPNSGSSSTSGGGGAVGFLRFKISPKLKDKSKTKEGSPYERCASEDCLKNAASSSTTATGTTTTSGRDTTTTSSPPTGGGGGGTSTGNRFTPIGRKEAEELEPPPIPPLPLNYQRSDDESCTTNEPKNELKKLRAMSKASRQAELKRLRIAQEIQREQEEIEVKIKDLETRGVEIEKELRGESESLEKNIENLGANDEGLVKEWLELMRSITRLKVRDEELSIRQQELQLEHRHAQLKEELNMRLSCSKLDKNSSDVAAEGAILNEMLEIVAKRQALRPSLDAAAAAAAASIGGGGGSSALPPLATTTPRSKDVSDI